MSAVEKLEALLERVQRNRAAPRTAAKAAPTTPKRAPSPLELAVEKELSSPPAAAPSPRRSSRPASPPRQTPQPRAARHAPLSEAPKTTPSIPVSLAEPPGPVPLEVPPRQSSGRNVAQIVTQAEPAVPLTFGALMDRTLALRPAPGGD